MVTRVGEEDEEGGDEVEAVQRGPRAAKSFRAARATVSGAGRAPDPDGEEKVIGKRVGEA